MGESVKSEKRLWSPGRFLCLWLVLVLPTFGCAFVNHVRYPGAPPPSYDVDADLKQLAEHIQPTTSVEGYYKAPSVAKRNEVIAGRLLMIDLQYLKWLREVCAGKQHFDAATDMLAMSLSLAATAAGAEATKTVLSAIGSGVIGAKATVNEQYYYKQTIAALVSAMNAGRKGVRVRIIGGMSKGLEEYSFEQALGDLDDYYQAGTFLGASIVIQKNAGTKEEEADEKLAILPSPTNEEIVARECIRGILVKLDANKYSAEDLAKMSKALDALGVKDAKSREEIFERLLWMLQRRDEVPAKSAVEMRTALKSAGLTVD